MIFNGLSPEREVCCGRRRARMAEIEPGSGRRAQVISFPHKKALPLPAGLLCTAFTGASDDALFLQVSDQAVDGFLIGGEADIGMISTSGYQCNQTGSF